MKCYNHNDVDAVGICAGCNKGLCMECIEVVEGSVACRGACAEGIVAVKHLIKKNINNTKYAGSQWNPNIYLFLLYGGGFCAMGYALNDTYSIAFYGFGVAFFIASFYSYILKKRLSKKV